MKMILRRITTENNVLSNTSNDALNQTPQLGNPYVPRSRGRPCLNHIRSFTESKAEEDQESGEEEPMVNC